MTDVLVERHMDEPLTDAEFLRMAQAAGGCLDLHRVEWNRSLLAADARHLVCHFTAVDLESVRRGAGSELRARRGLGLYIARRPRSR